MARKRRYAKARKATKSAIMVRGGFTPSSFTRGLSGAAKQQIGGYLKSKGMNDAAAAWAASQAVDKAADGIRSVGNRMGLFAYRPTRSGSNEGASATQPGIVMESTQKLTGMNGNYNSKMIKTLVEFGKKTGRALSMTQQSNGYEDDVLFNSSDAESSAEVDEFVQSFGFNQKEWYFPSSNAYPVASDKAQFPYSPGVEQSDQASYRLYGACTQEQTDWKFYNHNKYFPIVCKMHLCTLQNRLTIDDIADGVLNTALTVQEEDAIPRKWQFSTYLNRSALVHPKCRLQQSAFFRKSVRVEKTVTVKLAPGDIWNLKFRCHTGPGWDLLRMEADRELYGAAVPRAWFPIFEFHGVDCEFVENTSNRRVIGTSPGEVSMDCKKTLRIVNREQSPTLQTDIGQPVVRLVRVFRKYNHETLASLYNVNRSSIGNVPGAGTGYIPVVSDKQIEYAGGTSS